MLAQFLAVSYWEIFWIANEEDDRYTERNVEISIFYELWLIWDLHKIAARQLHRFASQCDLTSSNVLFSLYLDIGQDVSNLKTGISLCSVFWTAYFIKGSEEGSQTGRRVSLAKKSHIYWRNFDKCSGNKIWYGYGEFFFMRSMRNFILNFVIFLKKIKF